MILEFFWGRDISFGCFEGINQNYGCREVPPFRTENKKGFFPEAKTKNARLEEEKKRWSEGYASISALKERILQSSGSFSSPFFTTYPSKHTGKRERANFRKA